MAPDVPEGGPTAPDGADDPVQPADSPDPGPAAQPRHGGDPAVLSAAGDGPTPALPRSLAVTPSTPSEPDGPSEPDATGEPGSTPLGGSFGAPADMPPGGYPTGPAYGSPPGEAPARTSRPRRSRTHRALFGVAGGLAEYTGVDAVIYRVVFVVLSLFGGAGVLLYLIAMLVMPEEEQSSAPIESLAGRRRRGRSQAAVLLAAVAFVTIVSTSYGGPDGLAVLGLAIIAGVMLLRRSERARSAGALPGATPGAVRGNRPAGEPSVLEYGATPHILASEAERQRVGNLLTAAAGAGLLTLAEADERMFDAYAARTRGQLAALLIDMPSDWMARWEWAYDSGQAWAAPHAVTPAIVPDNPPATPEPRGRSFLGPLVLLLVAIIVSTAIAIDRSTGVDLEATHVLALSLGVVGAGLVVGAWYGRARWLAFVGAPIAAALTLAAAVPFSAHDGVGDRRWAPATLAAVQPEYRLGAGDARLDLTRVDFTAHTVHVKVRVGLGDLRVFVPPRVDVDVNGKAGLGRVSAFDNSADGVNATRSVTDLGPDGTGGGRLVLDVTLGLGEGRVLRETP